MEVSNVVKEEASLPAENVSVDGGCRAALEVPLFATIMREDRVSVVEVRNHDNCEREKHIFSF